MLAGLLFILKLLGILILSIVLLILAAFLLILFSPIRYRLQGAYHGDLAGSFSVSWLFGIIKVKGEKPALEEIKMEILLFGQALGRKKKKKQKKKRTSPAAKGREEILYSREKQETPVTKTEVPKQKTEQPIETQSTETQPPAKEEQKTETQAEPEKTEPEKPKGIRRVKLSDIPEEPPLENPFWYGREDTPSGDMGNTAAKTHSAEKKQSKSKHSRDDKKKKLKGKLAQIEEKMAALQKIWLQYTKIEQKREILKALWRFVRSVTKEILPRKLWAKGTLGTGNPETTGYLLAALGICKGKYGEHLQVQGNFAKRICELETAAQGKIVIGHMTFLALRLVLAKPVRPLIQIVLKKRRENHGEGI